MNNPLVIARARSARSNLAFKSGLLRAFGARNDELGFTFVEILLTLVILSACAVPLMRMFSTAVEQVGTVDEIRTAMDLGREEIEKIKNLALTEEQLKELGNVVSPPIMLNRTVWFTARVVDPDATPLKVTVFVFRDSLATKPVVSFVTIVSK